MNVLNTSVANTNYPNVQSRCDSSFTVFSLYFAGSECPMRKRTTCLMLFSVKCKCVADVLCV